MLGLHEALEGDTHVGIARLAQKVARFDGSGRP